jgi:hypothetical protein
MDVTFVIDVVPFGTDGAQRQRSQDAQTPGNHGGTAET